MRRVPCGVRSAFRACSAFRVCGGGERAKWWEVGMDDYRVIADEVAADIAAGRLRPGDRLPPLRRFARDRRIAATRRPPGSTANWASGG